MSKEIRIKAWDPQRKRMLTTPVWVEFRVINGTLRAFNYYPYHGEEQELEILQYTGLSDVNGIPLYEGDIYKKWGEVCVCESIKEIGYLEHQCLIFDRDFYILGNIYEDPELLEDV